MDLWVVAAAAGAGYVAKNLQNLSLDNNNEKNESSFNYSSKGCSESRNLFQQLRDKTCPFRRLARIKAAAAADDALGFTSSDQLSEKDVLEAGIVSLEKNELVEDYNLRTVSKVFDTEEKLGSEDLEVRNFTRVNRGKLVGSRKRGEDLFRPLYPLGSFLDDEIFGECEREEVSVNGLNSLVSAGRAVLISTANRMLTLSGNGDSFEGGQEEVKKGSADYIKASSVTSRSAWKGHDGMLLFVTGMIIGISSANTANKNVIDSLNKQLKQTQNLVEDLHEELDMKDMVTVKELTDLEEFLPPDGSNTSLSNQEPNASPSDVKANSLPQVDHRNENVELMSKIEAELEAELEMLERSMLDSKMDILSNVVELGSDFELDIVEGDLKPMKGSEIHGDTSESENETDPNPNNIYSRAPDYAVCPWELSLRLHELIETRLQARVKELEVALGNSRNGSQIQKDYSNTETRSSSDPHTPTFIHEHDDYNNTILNGSSSRGDYKDQVKEDKGYSTTVGDQGASWEKHTWSGFMSDDDCRDGNDSSDETEMLLLKRIIERTKSGSSVVFDLLRSSESDLMP